ncbi:MAG: VWA domain-containing protein, partial [Planctomycetes bacterium]|nr:VWA domain-containing protein [Planctomycetota bacterium]
MKDLQLSFATGWSPGAAIAVIALLLLVTLASYWRPYSVGRQRAVAALAAIRLLAIGLLLAMAFEPVVRYARINKGASRVLLLVDGSSSMTVSDSVGGRSRSDAARAVVTGDLGAVAPRLAADFTVEGYGVHDGAEARDFLSAEAAGARSSAFAAEAPRTDLATAVRAVARRAGTEGVRAVVLVTDGAENRPGSLPAYAESLGAPFYVVGVGSDIRNNPRFVDLAVADVKANSVAYAGIRERVRVTLTRSSAQPGEPATPVAVTLTTGGRSVAAGSAEFPPGGLRAEVTLEYVPDAAGRRDYEVTVEPDPRETLTQNNREVFTQEVRASKFAVLYLEGRLGFEFSRLQKYLKHEDEDLAYTLLVRKGKTPLFELQTTIEGGVTGVAFTWEQLLKYDAVIFGDVDPAFMGPEQLGHLDRFVSDKGRGLLVLGAARALQEGGYAETPLEAMLPVRLAAPPAAGAAGGEFVPRVTREGE